MYVGRGYTKTPGNPYVFRVKGQALTLPPQQVWAVVFFGLSWDVEACVAFPGNLVLTTVGGCRSCGDGG